MSGSHASHVRVRWFRRVDPPRPFLPWGGLGVAVWLAVLLFALVPFARWRIEGTVRDDVQRALREGGFGWVAVGVSGQLVSLSGTAPAEGAGDGAIAIAQRVRSTTWLGDLVSPVRVVGSFEVAPAPEAPPLAPATGWVFRAREGEGELTGRLADEATRRAVVEAAREKLAPRIPELRDALEVGSAGDPAVDERVARFALGLLAPCASGRAALEDGTLSLSCEVEAEADAERVRQQAAAGVEGAAVGEVDVLVRAHAEACDAALAALLLEPILFESGKSEVGAGSFGLLDRIAEAAASCPGQLRIEGHTDDRGEAEFNRVLSRARAEAVEAALVARGVPAERLHPTGHGADQPIGDNATEAGRAANRRIEIEVVRPDDR